MNRHFTEPNEPFRFAPYDASLESNLMRASRDKIEGIQSARLKHIVRYAYDKIPFYRRLWDASHFTPESVESINDITRIPTWNVGDQRRSIEKVPPFGDFTAAVANTELAYMLSTSGTTGTPRLARVYQSDLPGLRDIMARAFRWIGIGAGDILQVTFTYAPLGAAWCCTWAAQEVGAAVLPASSGRTTSSERQVELMRTARVTALMGTASYLMRLAEVAQQLGYDPKALSVRKIIIAGELAPASRREALERLWGAKVFDLFGSVDTLTWSSLDCDKSRSKHGALGMHIWEDACLVEVLDEQGKPVPAGQYGEMCVTSWTWRSSPKIRFRTGDLVAVEKGVCECGRTTARMLPVVGRTDHVIRLRATHIYPMALDAAIHGACEGPVEWLVEAVTRPDGDRLSVKIESSATEDVRRVALENDIRARLALNSVDLVFVPPGSTAETTGAGRDPKVRRIFDRREAINHRSR